MPRRNFRRTLHDTREGSSTETGGEELAKHRDAQNAQSAGDRRDPSSSLSLRSSLSRATLCLVKWRRRRRGFRLFTSRLCKWSHSARVSSVSRHDYLECHFISRVFNLSTERAPAAAKSIPDVLQRATPWNEDGSDIYF